MTMSALTELSGQQFTWHGRPFLKAAVPTGDNRGKTFTVAQPLADRYRIVRFFASGGMGLLLEGLDLRTQGRVLIKAILNYAPISLNVPPGIRVQYTDPVTHLQRMTYYLD